LLEILQKLIRLLGDLNAEYMIVGGVGLAAWLPPRATTDIDLVVAVSDEDAPDLGRLIARKLGGIASMRTMRFKSGISIQRVVVKEGNHDEVMIDLLLAADDHLRRALTRRRRIRIPELGSTYVATPEDLLIMKVRANRPQDRVDAQALVTQVPLDRRYVAAQMRRLGLISRWRLLSRPPGRKRRTQRRSTSG
jgi:hypothetical protein